ncbi:MAG: sodium:solute symporter family protein [Oligoflexales bacterium]|nr:sodium:solute symporter family protein [Oligoflexales bacterium]
MSLSFFIIIYLLVTVMIGGFSGKLVKTSNDFMLAGRKLPLILCAPTMFSTWYGSETIIGASGEFLDRGLLGVMEDPFGTALCFILIGLFIARPIYKMNVVTIVDFYRIQFGKKFEFISAILMILSYIGWIAAQFLAMAIIMEVVLGLPLSSGLFISSTIVCIYTMYGGMWSISLNDFLQTSVIVIGLVVLSFYVYLQIDDFSSFTAKTPENFFSFFPENRWDDWCNYLTAWITIGLGSIPQQDVFQRIMSAKSEKVSVWSSYLASVMYLTIGILPLFLALAYKLSNPALANIPNSKLLLEAVLLQEHTIIKVLFIGALLSAIMSSASGALLAPATILEENLLRPIIPNIPDKTKLLLLRGSVLITAIFSGLYAMTSSNVYYLVAESSIISLVSLFIPLVAGIYWKKASTTGAMLSIILGPITWLLCRNLGYETESALLGLFASSLGMLIGSQVERIKQGSQNE